MTATKQNVTPQPAPGESAGAAAQIPPGGIAAQLAAVLAGDKAGSGSAQGTVETPAEIEVNWGGTPRKVKVADLVAAAQRKEELDSLQTVLDSKWKTIGKADQLLALHQAIEEMTPEQKLRMQDYIQRTDVAADEPEADDDESSLERDIRTAVRGKPQPNGKVDPAQKRLDMLEDAVTKMARVLQGKHQQEQQQTLTQKVGAAMEQFPILKAQSGSDYWKRAILSQMQADPSASLDSVVAATAQAAQQLVQRGAKDVLAEVTGSADGSIPERKFKGADLSSGDIREAALAAFIAARA